LTFKKDASNYYSSAETKKSDILNSFYNIIYSTTVVEQKYIQLKIDDALEKLNFIFSSYLDEIRLISDNYNAEYGLNINTRLIPKDTDPKPLNYFSDPFEDYPSFTVNIN